MRANKPIFIIGFPRTASKLIAHKLNKYTECCIVEEMHIWSPWHRDIPRLLRKVRRMDEPERIEKLKAELKSRHIFGSYWRAWQTERPYSVFRLTEPELDGALRGVTGGWELLLAMIEAQRVHYKKLRAGARHAVHFIYIGKLLKHFPEARIIFLTRPVSEINKSQYRKKLPDNINVIKKLWRKLILSMYGYSQYFLAAGFFLKWANDERFLIVEYHEVVNKPVESFQRICNHIGVKYDPKIADLSRKYDSSYDSPQSRVLPSDSIVWKGQK